MFVDKLKLTNFRNYSELDISFTPNINIFYGYNAQGKTNILEALYFTATGRSHRTTKDRELINWDENEIYINTLIEKESENVKINIKIDKEHKKNIRVNDIPIKKMGELMGNLNAVMFSPEDLRLVKEGPSERRRFIDIAVSQIRPNYFYCLQQYLKVIHQRNTLLREAKHKRSLLDTLPIWDNNLVEIGSKIMYYRYVYLKKISEYIKIIHKRISNEEIKIEYDPSFKCDFSDMEEIKKTMASLIEKNIEKDLNYGTTSVGPHRDDFDIFINDISTKTYGSQGQQRTAALSLKLAEIELFKEELGEYPILLLDDVMSELDDNRQRYLLDNLNNIQVFITCTNADKYKGENASFYRVSKGHVTKE